MTVDFDNDIITVEFAGTGPGIEPENTVDEFTCIFNQQSEFIQPCKCIKLNNHSNIQEPSCWVVPGSTVRQDNEEMYA